MNIKINKKHLGIAALLSATAAASVFAAGGTTTTATTLTNKFFGQNGQRSAHTETAAERTEHQAKMAASLATALGTTPDAIITQLNAGKSPRDIIKASGLDEATVKAQLDASRDADMKTRLAADVTSGKLTQAQADKIFADKDNYKNGKRGGGRGHGGNHDGMLTNAATVLGTTKEALQAKITAGTTLDAIVTASGMTETDFHTKMEALHESEMKTKLAAEVTAGTITQAQADQRLADIKNHTGGRGFGHDKKSTTGSTSVAQ